MRWETTSWDDTSPAMRQFGELWDSQFKTDPKAVHLIVHLENGQHVYFTEETIIHKIQAHSRKTNCAKGTISQGPCSTVMFQSTTPGTYRRLFKPRIKMAGHKSINSTDALGGVYTFHPNNSQVLLLETSAAHCKGAYLISGSESCRQSGLYLFWEAYQMQGLLEENAHWDATMTEASASQSLCQVRNLFAILIAWCGLSNTLQLWESMSLPG
jgi:hypothetical protein